MNIVYSGKFDQFIALLTNSTIATYKRFKGTALLDRIQDASEVRDSVNQRAFLQDVTCMSLVQTNHFKELMCMDTEVLSHKYHVLSLITACADPSLEQDYIALGMSKGQIILMHVRQLQRVFCRFTIHRAALEFVHYLPQSRCFVSICSELYFKIWRIKNVQKKTQIILDYRITKQVAFMEIIEYKGKDRILMLLKSGGFEMFQFKGDQLSWIQTETGRDHEAKVTGLAFNKTMGLIVSSDASGVVRIWT